MRTLIVVVAAGALVIAPIECAARWLRYDRLVHSHGQQWLHFFEISRRRPLTDAEQREMEWHDKMHLEYLRLRSPSIFPQPKLE
jgi:hypothetical protein